MTKLDIEWTAHPDFEHQLSKVFQDDPIDGIKELVANMFDADAPEARLHYDAESQLLIAEDIGTGMGVRELRQGFYKSGESLTRKSGTTKKGRNPMGNFGIGTIVMQYLAIGYTLETWRNGKKLTVTETFPEGRRPDKVVRVIPEPCNPALHGTKITIKPTRFPGDEFTLDQLTRRLAIGIDVETRLQEGDTFDMYVNDELVTVTNPSPALVFHINEYHDLIGQVQGTVNFYVRRPPKGGIVTRVRGRQVGHEENLVDLLPSLMKNRVYADIAVDGMVNRISLNRKRFQMDSPHYRALIALLKSTFKTYRGEVEGYQERKRHQFTVTAAGPALEQTGQLIGSVSILGSPHAIQSTSANPAELAPERDRDEVAAPGTSATLEVNDPGDIGVILRSTELKGGRKLALVADQSPNLGTINPDTGAININVKHPYYTVPAKAPVQPLQIQIRYGLSVALARNTFLSAKGNRHAEAILDARDEAIMRIAKDVFGNQPRLVNALMNERTTSRRGLNPNRMYTISELYQESLLDSIWLRKFDDAGLLKPVTYDEVERRYFGASVILALEPMRGGTPAFQLVKEYADRERTEVTRARRQQLPDAVDSRIARLRNTLPYARDISVTKTPLYVIDAGFENLFVEAYRAGHIKPRHTVPDDFLTIDDRVKEPPPGNPVVGIDGTESSDFAMAMRSSLRAPGINDRDVAAAHAYNTKVQFDPGDVILHIGYGYGKVIKVYHRSFTVQFKSDTLELAHNR